MRRRQPLPTCWLMTDERMGEALWPALDRLPRGAGVVFRHYSLVKADRRALFDRVMRVTRRRGLILSLAGTPASAAAWRADGVHGRSSMRRTARPLVRSVACHDVRALVAARRAGPGLRFVSSVFATRSHPGARTLGRVRFGLMVRGRSDGVIALGGMDERRARPLRPMGIHGWAAIDAWRQARRGTVRT